MSFSNHSLPFPVVHSYSYSGSQVHRGFIPIFPVPLVIPIPSLLFPASQGDTSISSHLLLFFKDIAKPTTSKLTTNESVLVSQTTEIKLKIQMSKLVTFLQ